MAAEAWAHQEERGAAVKPLRRECRTVSAYLWKPACVFFVLHARQWVRRAPGIPCSLVFEGRRCCITWAYHAAGMLVACPVAERVTECQTLSVEHRRICEYARAGYTHSLQAGRRRRLPFDRFIGSAAHFVACDRCAHRLKRPPGERTAAGASPTAASGRQHSANGRCGKNAPRGMRRANRRTSHEEICFDRRNDGRAGRGCVRLAGAGRVQGLLRRLAGWRLGRRLRLITGMAADCRSA